MSGILDAGGNELNPTTAAEEADRARLGDDFGHVSARQEDEPTGLVEVVDEKTENPAYDFGEGELADKVKAMKAKLAEKGLVPTTEAGEGAKKEEQTGEGTKTGPLKGSDVDWSEFDLDQNYAHFYPQSEFTVTGQGPKWVVVINEYESFEKSYNAHGVDKEGQPKGLGGFITSRLNSPPDKGTGPWTLIAVLPATMGNGAAVLMRKVPIVLPDPKPLEKETKPEEVTPASLDETDKAATEWAGEGQPSVSEGVLASIIDGGEAVIAPAPNVIEQVAAEALDGPDVG